MNIVFFDTETTGKEKDDRLCQLGYKQSSVVNDTIQNVYVFNEFFKTEKPISIEAMSIHNITNKMVAEKPLFMESEFYKETKRLFESETTFVVAHNAKFDIAMLEKEGIVPKNVICTLKLARHLDSEGKIPSYKLQYLRYLLELVDGDVGIVAHDALGDVVVLEALFHRLYKKLGEVWSVPFPLPEDYLNEMARISRKPVKIPRFQFGKYIGKKIEDVANTDRGYLEWLYKAETQKEDKDEDLVYTLKMFI
jgi:DNA polymerase III epsilon subunit-like protein